MRKTITKEELEIIKSTLEYELVEIVDAHTQHYTESFISEMVDDEGIEKFEKKFFPAVENDIDYINDLIEPIFNNNGYTDFFGWTKNKRYLYIKKDGFLDFSVSREEISEYLSHDETLLMVSKIGGGFFEGWVEQREKLATVWRAGTKNKTKRMPRALPEKTTI